MLEAAYALGLWVTLGADIPVRRATPPASPRAHVVRGGGTPSTKQLDPLWEGRANWR